MIMTSTSQAGFFDTRPMGPQNGGLVREMGISEKSMLVKYYNLAWYDVSIYGEHMGFLWVLHGSISICSISDSQRHFLCEHAPCGPNLPWECIRINPFSWRDCRSWLKLLVLFGCFRTCIPKYSWNNHHPWRCAGRRHQGTRQLAEHTVKTREIRCAILNPEMSR